MGVLAETELAQAREAYWWALAAAIVLEKQIERLSQSTTRDRVRCPCPFPESQLMEEKVLGAEQEVQQGLTRG